MGGGIPEKKKETKLERKRRARAELSISFNIAWCFHALSKVECTY